MPHCTCAAAVPGARVEVFDMESGAAREVWTRKRDGYSLNDPRNGTYHQLPDGPAAGGARITVMTRSFSSSAAAERDTAPNCFKQAYGLVMATSPAA